MKFSLWIVGLGALAGIGIYALSEAQKRQNMLAEEKRRTRENKRIDSELDDSFPASDPPSWSPSTTSTSDYHH